MFMYVHEIGWMCILCSDVGLVDVVAVQHGYNNVHPFEFMIVVKLNGFLNIYAICGVEAHDRWALALSNVICKQSENKEKIGIIIDMRSEYFILAKNCVYRKFTLWKYGALIIHAEKIYGEEYKIFGLFLDYRMS